MKRLLFVLAAGFVSSCSLNTDAPSEPTDPATETFASGLGVDIPHMVKTQSGVYYKDGPLGSGTPISGQPAVILSYFEYLKSGATVGNVSSAPQLLSSMIPGLQEGMQGMKPGGERLIVVPSALGYGNSNTVPGVPPNSTLVFDVVFKGYQTP
jgi:FKBP-type peptidyl-prolyl cis-trans isomerase FkpA